MQEVLIGQQKFDGKFVPEQLSRLAFPGQPPSRRVKRVESCENILPPMVYALVPLAAKKNRDAIMTVDFPIVEDDLVEELRIHAGRSRIGSRIGSRS
jgi:hypothetical protein